MTNNVSVNLHLRMVKGPAAKTTSITGDLARLLAACNATVCPGGKAPSSADAIWPHESKQTEQHVPLSESYATYRPLFKDHGEARRAAASDACSWPQPGFNLYSLFVPLLTSRRPAPQSQESSKPFPSLKQSFGLPASSSRRRSAVRTCAGSKMAVSMLECMAAWPRTFGATASCPRPSAHEASLPSLARMCSQSKKGTPSILILSLVRFHIGVCSSPHSWFGQTPARTGKAPNSNTWEMSRSRAWMYAVHEASRSQSGQVATC
mmetsp:Transcript_19052/g.54670  ORF Transcript_19052/g.54670 Transcript_19052/m.54670 type:complete len:264 (+) Transcript_19052:1062-1853(+)